MYFYESGDHNFLKSLINFDRDNISDRVLKKIGQYCVQSDFQPEITGRVSTAARSLCMWVRAMEAYGQIYRVVEPKRQRLNAALSTLKEKQNALTNAKAKLSDVSGAFCVHSYTDELPWVDKPHQCHVLFSLTYLSIMTAK